MLFHSYPVNELHTVNLRIQWVLHTQHLLMFNTHTTGGLWTAFRNTSCCMCISFKTNFTFNTTCIIKSQTYIHTTVPMYLILSVQSLSQHFNAASFNSLSEATSKKAFFINTLFFALRAERKWRYVRLPTSKWPAVKMSTSKLCTQKCRHHLCTILTVIILTIT
jgi:hypothetical protein